MPYFLEKPKDTKSIINLIYKENLEKPFKYSTGEKIETSLWDQEAQRVRFNNLPSIEKQRARATNSVLERYEQFLDALLIDYKTNGTHVTKELLHNEFEKKFKIEPKIIKTTKENDFFVLLQNFIDMCERGEIMTKKGTKISTQRISHYKTFKKNMLLFRKNININEIDMVFYNDFVAQRSKDGKSLNTIGKEINILKSFMNQGLKRKWHKNEVFKDDDFKTFDEKIERVYFDDDRLDKIWNLKFEKQPGLEKARDEYIIYCYTGFRVSDSTRIKSVNIMKKENLFKIEMQKTGEIVYVPIHDRVLILMEKYGRLPNDIIESKMNYYIKDICKEAEFFDDFYFRKTVAGETKPHIKPFWSLVTNHTARRTACTNLIKAGVLESNVKKLLGIKSQKSFDRYCCISQMEAAMTAAKHPYFLKPVVKVPKKKAVKKKS